MNQLKWLRQNTYLLQIATHARKISRHKFYWYCDSSE